MHVPLGNSTPPGWVALVAPLLEQAEREGATVIQIKQKFGTLRFYCDDASPALSAAITAAVKESARTCEQCGAPGSMIDNGWLRTLCAAHRDFTAERLPPART